MRGPPLLAAAGAVDRWPLDVRHAVHASGHELALAVRALVDAGGNTGIEASAAKPPKQVSLPSLSKAAPTSAKTTLGGSGAQALRAMLMRRS